MVNKFVYLILTMFFLIGCNTTRELTMSKNYVQEDYLKEKYIFKGDSSNSEFLSYSLSKKTLEDAKSSARAFVLEDFKMPENEQVKFIKQLESFKYEDDMYYRFILMLPEPILQEDQRFNFIIKDSLNYNYVESVYNYNYKYRKKNYFGFISVGYHYVWLIKTSKPISDKYFEKNNRPISLIVIFPNGSERHYLILDK